MDPKLPRDLLIRLENPSLPVVTLQAIRETRAWLDQLEAQSIRNARRLGASVKVIAHSLGLSRQGIYRKLRVMDTKSHSGHSSEPPA